MTLLNRFLVFLLAATSIFGVSPKPSSAASQSVKIFVQKDSTSFGEWFALLPGGNRALAIRPNSVSGNNDLVLLDLTSGAFTVLAKGRISIGTTRLPKGSIITDFELDKGLLAPDGDQILFREVTRKYKVTVQNPHGYGEALPSSAEIDTWYSLSLSSRVKTNLNAKLGAYSINSLAPTSVKNRYLVEACKPQNYKSSNGLWSYGYSCAPAVRSLGSVKKTPLDKYTTFGHSSPNGKFVLIDKVQGTYLVDTRNLKMIKVAPGVSGFSSIPFDDGKTILSSNRTLKFGETLTLRSVGSKQGAIVARGVLGAYFIDSESGRVVVGAMPNYYGVPVKGLSALASPIEIHSCNLDGLFPVATNSTCTANYQAPTISVKSVDECLPSTDFSPWGEVRVTLKVTGGNFESYQWQSTGGPSVIGALTPDGTWADIQADVDITSMSGDFGLIGHVSSGVPERLGLALPANNCVLPGH